MKSPMQELLYQLRKERTDSKIEWLGCFEGVIKHSCQLYNYKKRKFINNGLHPNPVSALQAFKNALEFENLGYSTETENIELTEKE